MTTKKWPYIDYFALLVLTTMVLTRSQHFGDSLNLPDASLAVFFFAGLLRSQFVFILLLAAAALIDFIVINTGASAFCISPAYFFLIPTYGLMGVAGKFCRKYIPLNFSELAKTMFVFASATALAFTVSNSSFYLFSGRIGNPSLAHFISQFGDYFFPYSATSCGYGLVGFLLIKVYRILISGELAEKTI